LNIARIQQERRSADIDIMEYSPDEIELSKRSSASSKPLLRDEFLPGETEE